MLVCCGFYFTEIHTERKKERCKIPNIFFYLETTHPYTCNGLHTNTHKNMCVFVYVNLDSGTYAQTHKNHLVLFYFNYFSYTVSDLLPEFIIVVCTYCIYSFITGVPDFKKKTSHTSAVQPAKAGQDS